MPYEPTEKLNPQQLKIDQHFHSAHSIAKFYGVDDRVEVKFIKTNEIVKRHKRAKIFCAKREWDEKSESGYMIKLENEFHEEIDSIKVFSVRRHESISKYFLLWNYRHKFHLSDNNDVALNGVTGSGINKAQEEFAEKEGAAFVRDGGVVPSRFLIGDLIQREIDYALGVTFKDVKWGLVEATDGEFLVADCFGDFPFMPISPTLAFWAGETDQKINKSQLAGVNKIAFEKATEFVFARCLSDCPVS